MSHSKSILSSVFRRKGGSGKRTRLFEEFDVESRNAIIGFVHLGDGELPVIASTPTSGSWFLLTTKRLLLFETEKSTDVELTSLAQESPAEFGLVNKSDLTVLNLELSDGRKLKVQVEAGPPFSGVWNVLRGVVARNKAMQ